MSGRPHARDDGQDPFEHALHRALADLAADAPPAESLTRPTDRRPSSRVWLIAAAVAAAVALPTAGALLLGDRETDRPLVPPAISRPATPAPTTGNTSTSLGSSTLPDPAASSTGAVRTTDRPSTSVPRTSSRSSTGSGSVLAPGIAAQLPATLPFRLVLPAGWRVAGAEANGEAPGADYWNLVLHLRSGSRQAEVRVFTGEGQQVVSPTTVTLGDQRWVLGATPVSGDATSLHRRATMSAGNYGVWVDAVDDADVRGLATGFEFVADPDDVTSWTPKADFLGGG